MKKELLSDLFNALLIVLLLYAGFSKIADHNSFVSAMNNQPIPNLFRTGLIFLLPTIEIITALLIMFEKTRFAGICCFLMLMIAFSIYITMALLKLFPFTPCPCGGIFARLKWPGHLVLNIGFIIAGFIALRLAKKHVLKRP
ncbi:hypothetical protein MTO98_25900 [Mucilaginibacter sp. SMC90]|uniref:MauE/DoxX family redox-associated membrane protein n=1 Tax=Mucilaginibacter sp. SMC90 TaxID=2929803 RepID=UPI001FB29861|nr:MauE/DoxX family redox-associated membrane protein [Mucilaginibacter sp. SMC90]UOE47848.1 hypothetical protein MTO98_25900 [Mucilaginibacter sp. SMC90]